MKKAGLMTSHVVWTAVASIFAVKKERRGLFISMFFNSNTIFVGLPINQALFGDASIPYVLIYYMCNTTFFWTLGTYLIQRDGEGEAEFDLKTSLKKIFSPPLMGFMLGLVIVILHIKLPVFLASDLQYLGSLSLDGCHCLLGTSPNFDETSFYHPVCHACHDQCSCCC